MQFTSCADVTKAKARIGPDAGLGAHRHALPDDGPRSDQDAAGNPRTGLNHRVRTDGNGFANLGMRVDKGCGMNNGFGRRARIKALAMRA